MPSYTIAAILSIVCVSVLVIACSGETEVSPTFEPSIPTERGQRIFAENCAVCHGVNGEGQPNWSTTKADGTLPAPPLNGNGHTWHHGDGTLYKQVKLGGAYLDLPGFKSGMPAFGDKLTHQEIIDVLTYVKSLWGNQAVHGTTKRDAQAMVSENDPFPVAPTDTQSGR